MTYKVKVTKRAISDLTRLGNSLATDWPDGAVRFTEQFQAGVSRLESYPLSCGLAFENAYFVEEVRHLLFKLTSQRTYRALFTIQADRVTVFAIRAPGQKPLRPRHLE